jgi:hypothetical protein
MFPIWYGEGHPDAPIREQQRKRGEWLFSSTGSGTTGVQE